MQSSNIPAKIPLPFAYAAGSGYKNTIPVASQIGITNGKASLTDGFPPLTFQALSAGGTPPFGADFNGILNEITAIQQWQNAGGFFPYDSTFATAVGGYPLGAIIQSANTLGLWISTAENNTTNPDLSGTGWVPLSFYGSSGINCATSVGTTITVSNLNASYPIINLIGSLTANCTVILPNFVKDWVIVNGTNDNGYTVQVKTAAGTGVNVAPNQSTYVYGNGTNIYYANSAQVSSFNGRVGAVTLNATDVTTALGYTPVNPSQFVRLNAQNGYEILPDGYIMQWGTNTPGSGAQTIYFPITFPHAVFSVQGTWNGAYGGGGSQNIVACTDIGNTRFILSCFNTSAGPAAATCGWIAFGY